MAGRLKSSDNIANADNFATISISYFVVVNQISMEKYLVSNKLFQESPKPYLRHGWKRSLIELNCRFDSKYRHYLSTLLIQSYCEVWGIIWRMDFHAKLISIVLLSLLLGIAVNCLDQSKVSV